MAVQLSDIFQMIDAGQRAKETRTNFLDQLREQQAARSLREREMLQQDSQFQQQHSLDSQRLAEMIAQGKQAREMGIANLLMSGAQAVKPRQHDMLGGLLSSVSSPVDVTGPSNATIGGQPFYVPGPAERQESILRMQENVEDDFFDSDVKQIWPMLNPYQRQLVGMAKLTNKVPSLRGEGTVGEVNRLWAVAQLPDDNPVWEGMAPETIARTKKAYEQSFTNFWQNEHLKATRPTGGGWSGPAGYNIQVTEKARSIFSQYTLKASEQLQTNPAYGKADPATKRSMESALAWKLMTDDGNNGKLNVKDPAATAALESARRDIEQAPSVLKKQGGAIADLLSANGIELYPSK